MKSIILLLACFSLLLSDSLDSLLQEYKATSDQSLRTINEKIGHVVIYSQKDIRLMQYTKLNDIIKELPLINVNTNRFGLTNYSLAGSKTTTSGFFRFFINDHELSSGYDQSTSLAWGDLPLDFVDHVEIYYVESSLSLGNETGIYYVRIYTKSATRENSSEIMATLNSQGSHSQSLTHSQSFENGWSYLLFFNKDKVQKTTDYKNASLKNNSDRKYVYADISNETTNINIGYTDVTANNYAGLALDAIPDDGKITSKDFFFDLTQYVLDDRSMKINVSIDVSDRTYAEQNAQGMALVPVLNLSNLGLTIPKEFYEDLRFIKTNAYVSKIFDYLDNSFLTAVNIKNKTYDVKNRETVNFANIKKSVGAYNDFDEETIASLLLQDNYKLNDTLTLIANTKFDHYSRTGYVGNTSETLYKIGAVYTPTDHLGLKGFYTDTTLQPTFYSIDYAAKSNTNLKSQHYKFYTLEAVYTMGESKFGVTYDNVRIDDFLYLTPVGFINIDHQIKTEGIIFDYEYSFSNRDKIHLNYYTSTLSEQINNSTKGGYIKFMGGYQKFDYFASLIYRNAYHYIDVSVPDSFDVSLGATYHATKDLSYSIKATNVLNQSTRSLYSEGINGANFALDDNDRSVSFTIRWVF